ncbi:MAG: UvrD-helicase domain-containing protein [Coprococcus sp.]
MSIQWSEKQQAVIDARGCSVLVSAAAGSGKTAVLVERLIRLLTDEKHPVDIERLLVVTFTNAAAAEMRERIGRGLDQKLLEEPDHTAWIRQKLLLPCAQISTIHSLCLKTIREHFEVLDLDPSFRLGDEAELKLLKSDVAEDVMETYYASENRAFRAFVDRYANGKTDQGIAEMIIALYDYSRGFPWPEYS